MSLPKYENVLLLQTWFWRLHKLKNVMLRSKQNKTSYIVGNKHTMQTNCIWTLMLVKITVSYMRQHYLMEPYMYTGDSFLWSWLAGSLLSVNSAAVSSPLVGSTGSYSFAFSSLSGREPVSDSASTSASGLKKKKALPCIYHRLQRKGPHKQWYRSWKKKKGKKCYWILRIES